MSIRVLKITHNVAITAIAPKKSPTANRKTVITSIEFKGFIIERVRFTNNPFNNDETTITKYVYFYPDDGGGPISIYITTGSGGFTFWQR